MSISLALLKPFANAFGFTVYGGPGTRKTNAIHTLPYPIWHADMEQGNASLLPWTRRTRRWNDTTWTPFSDSERNAAFEAINQPNKDFIKNTTRILPRPLIDTVFYDNMDSLSWRQFIEDIINFDPTQYNSIAVDAAPEMNEMVRTACKGQGNELAPFNPKFWTTVQDQTSAAIRYLRNYRAQGVFLYFTSSEIIDKDYVTDPREQDAKARENPISVKGNVNMYGKLIPLMQHAIDIQLHARIQNGNVVWVCRNEPIALGSSAMWEAKDRTGRLPDHGICQPNVRWLLDEIFGEARRKEIYASNTNNHLTPA